MHAHSIAGHDPAHGLVLERLPNGELAWLRAELDSAIRDADQVAQDLTRRLARYDDQTEVRYILTDVGRRALDEDRRARATEALFGQPWPRVSEVA